MSLFQRSLYGEDPSFTNLFRMLDDFATYNREFQGTQGGGHVRQRLFSPKFDVSETETAFELHGELPGVDRENLNIEFMEPQTLVIRGRVERNYSSGTPPAAAVEDTQTSGAITEGTETRHQAAVSKEDTEAAKENEESTAVAAPQATRPSPRKERYWHQERSIGEFHRTFNFHTRVDETAVSANLDRGVLHVTIPKAAKHETRRVNIN